MQLINLRPKGFTLIELLIVITILGLLMSLVAPQMLGKVDSTQRKTAAAQMNNIQTALDTFRLDVGKYPSNLAELIQSSTRGWDGPYLPKQVPLDPWGNAYQYKIPGDNGSDYSLLSYAKDGQEGGEDDNEDILHK
jgi:general secretion pathway protein G